jgi:O-antigen/teichoic acid export membrane protein
LKYIPVNLYGFWLASGNIIAWIGAFDPGMSTVMQQRIGVSMGANDNARIGHYIGSSLIISSTIILILSIILIIFYHFIFTWLDIEDQSLIVNLQKPVIFAGIGTLCTILSFSFAGINCGLQLFKPVGYVGLGANTVGILITFILLPSYGLTSLGFAMLIRGLFDLSGNIIILWNHAKKSKILIQFRINETTKLVGDVSFNFFSKLGTLLTDNSQSFFITKFISPESAVVFRFTKNIPEISKLFISRPAAAIMPVFSKYLGQNPAIEDVKLKLMKMINYSVWISGMIFIGFVLLNKSFIDLWIGDKFYAGNVTNILLVFWVVLSSFMSNLSYTVFAFGDIRKNNLVIFIQSLAFIILMLLFINPLGLKGMALALVLSQTCISLIYYPLKLNKFIKLRRDEFYAIFKEVLIVFIIVLLMFFVSFYVDFSIPSWYKFITYIIACVFCYSLFLSLISQKFKNEIKHLFINSMHNLTNYLRKKS